MSYLNEIKRKVKIAKLTLEMKGVKLSLWYKKKLLAYHTWRQNRLERRKEYLDSLIFQRGEDE